MTRCVANDGSAVRMASAIVAARRRFVTGSGKSLPPTRRSWGRILSAGLSLVTLIDNAVVRAVDILSEVRSTDVLVAFSMHRSRRDSRSPVPGVQEAGGTVLVITDDSDAPAIAFADAAVVVDTESVSYADSAQPPSRPSATCCRRSGRRAPGARRRLADQDRLARELDLYER